MTKPFTIVLVEPQIPPNTGNIARLCAATGTTLHLVGKLGFDLSDKQLKRAGLDYWDHVDWHHFTDVEAYFDNCVAANIHLLTSKTDRVYFDASFEPGDFLVFGSETLGLSDTIRRRFSDRCLTIPMKNKLKGVRCLNLSTAAGIVLYEGIRQNS